MKALVASAEWAPRQGYELTDKETAERRARVGSSVWRSPVFEIKDVEVAALKADEVLIRVKRCGICGSDIHLYETDDEGYIIFSGPVKLPCTIGHEYSGVVEEVGADVVNFTPGAKVAAESIIWCGLCTPCRSGAFNQCEKVELAGITSAGALAEFVVAKERICWSIDSLEELYSEDRIFDIGALIEPIGCAYNGLFVSGGGFAPGSVVAVFGVGAIGLAAVALARISGASLVIAFDIIDERLDIAKKMGADLVYNSKDPSQSPSPAEVILDITGGKGADIQVEAAGAANSTIPQMERSLAVNGKIIYLGRAATSTAMHLDNLVTGANKVIGSRGHSGYGIYSNIIRLIKSGRLKVDTMITSTFNFEDVMAAMKRSTLRTDGKIMIRLD